MLNVYGNLVGLLGCLALYVGWLLGAWLGVAFACVGVPLIGWSMAISRRVPSKVRLASALIRRTERSGYRASYFQSTCRDPCMRVLTRLVHWKCGQWSEAGSVIARYRVSEAFAFVPSSQKLSDLLASGAVSDSQVQAAIKQAVVAAAEPPLNQPNVGDGPGSRRQARAVS